MARATLRDIATALGLSVNTVSRALAGKDSVSDRTRELVRTEAERVGYVPNSLARSLVLGAAMTLGLVITNTSNPFYARLIRSIAESSRVQGYSLLLMVTDESVENERTVTESLLRLAVDGAIVVPVQHDSDHWRRVHDAGVPLVFVSRDVDSIGCDFVGIDNQFGASAATRHLIEGGARSIWVFEEDLPIKTVSDRVQGHRRAMLDAGLAADDDHVLMVPAVRHDSLLPWEPEESYRVAEDALRGHDVPDAIAVGKDHFALGVYRALAERGLRVPQDVAVVGYGDYSYGAYLQPPLSSVRLPVDDVGSKAVELLLQRIRNEGAPEPKKLQLRPELIVRTSTDSRSREELGARPRL